MRLGARVMCVQDCGTLARRPISHRYPGRRSFFAGAQRERGKERRYEATRRPQGVDPFGERAHIVPAFRESDPVSTESEGV